MKHFIMRRFTINRSLTDKHFYSTEGGDGSIPQKAKGIVQSILHGTQDSHISIERENDTYSKILSRGKYIHKIEFHKIKPEKWEDNEYYPKVQVKYGLESIKLCGSWTSDIGDLDTAVHIWEYQGYSTYDKMALKLQSDSEYLNFLGELRKCVVSRETQMLLEFNFWKTAVPKERNGIYELSIAWKVIRMGAKLVVNKLEFRKVGLECRRQFCEPIGAWFSQLGTLNYVHHMWVYPYHLFPFLEICIPEKLLEKKHGRLMVGLIQYIIPVIYYFIFSAFSG